MRKIIDTVATLFDNLLEGGGDETLDVAKPQAEETPALRKEEPAKIARLHTIESPELILSEDFKSQTWPISGGWGYDKDSAVVIKLADDSQAVAFEYKFILYRAYEELIVFQPHESRYAHVRTSDFQQTLVHDGRRSYDHLVFTVTAYPEAAWFALRDSCASLVDAEAAIPTIADKRISYRTECWFDISEAFR